MSNYKYRSVWISDLHLGSSSANPKLVNSFLDSFSCEYLYLVGDIIDGWRLKSRWYWPNANSTTIRKILKKVKQGSKVFYIPGNHDEFIREWLPTKISFGEIIFKNEVVHHCLDGRKMLVLHGDIFDSIVRLNPWLNVMGSTAYDFLVVSNRFLSRVLKIFGKKHWSFSKFIKKNFKDAANFIFNFEHHISSYTKTRGYDGVICGHIHKAESRNINGIYYYNCGDWVESFTAVVEDFDGSIRIIEFKQ